MLQITGQLGDVMKESVMLAKFYLKAHADYLGSYAKVFDIWDIHVHFPAGAIPKDGPGGLCVKCPRVAIRRSNVPIVVIIPTLLRYGNRDAPC